MLRDSGVKDMSTSIVTGATGFIGTALCKELLAQGDEVYAVIRPKSSRANKLIALQEHGDTTKGRLRILEADLGRLAESLPDAQLHADVFFHLAWNGSAGAEREDFELQQKNIGYIME